MKFKKILKYTGIVLAALLILLLVVLIAFDWNWLKPWLNDRLSDISGRSLVIEGDIDVDLGWATRIALEDLRFENADWGSDPLMARVEAAKIDVKLMPLWDGNIILTRLELKKPWLLLETSEQDRGNWNIFPESDTQTPEEISGTGLPVIDSLIIQDGEIRYRDPSAGTDLKGTLATEPAENGGHRIIINADGRLLESQLAFCFTGDPLTDLQETGITYQARMTADMGQSRGEAKGVIHHPRHFQGMDLKVTLQGPDFSTPAALWDDDFPETPPYRIDTHLILENGVWKLTESTASLGESDFTGSVIIDPTDDPLAVTADLDFDVLYVEQLTALFDNPEAKSDTSSGAPLDASFLTNLNADIHIAADQIIAPDIPLEDVRLDIDLENGQLSVSPLKFDLHGGTVTAAVSLNAAEDPLSGTMDADFKQLALSEILDPFTDLDADELGILSGNLDMSLTQADPTALDRDILFPYAGILKIAESRLSYANPAKDTDLTLTVQTNPASDRDWPTRITGDGRYRGERFDLSFQGDPLLDLREPDDPYSLDLVTEAADTQAKISGEVRRAFDLKGFDITLGMEGPNPARIYPLIGVSLPDLPPYDLKGRISLNNGVWKFQNFQGRVGDSDLSGDIRIDTAGETPDLTADLSSEHLDFDDLAGLVGAAPETGPGETASAAQSRQAAREAGDPEVLPEEPYGMERLKAMNAVVAYRAKKVQAPDLPLDELNIDFNLQGGGMLFEPLKFDIGEGSVDMRLSLEPQNGTLQGMVEAEIRRVDLKRVLRQFDIADESAGVIGGRAKYWFQGMSVADLLASADGGAYLLMSGGKLDSLLIELAGLDAGEAIISYFADTEAVRIDCSYADLHARDGVMTLEKFIVDTVDTFFSISGTIRFGEETMDLLIHPHPKDISLFTARSPLHITGSFKNPEAFPDRSALAARGATALGLGLVAGPAAILPLIETGTTEEPPVCQGIIQFIKEAR